MTDTRQKLRGLFLAALMVCSVFAGTVALGGMAAAANAGNDSGFGTGNLPGGQVTDDTPQANATRGAEINIGDVSFANKGNVTNVTVNATEGPDSNGAIPASSIETVEVVLYNGTTVADRESLPYNSHDTKVSFGPPAVTDVDRIVVKATISSTADEGEVIDANLDVQTNPTGEIQTANNQQIKVGSNGFLSGRVSDTNNNDIENATIIVRNQTTGYNQTFVNATNENGDYTISVAPGTYDVFAQRDGFSTAQPRTRTVSANETTTANFVLTRLLEPERITVNPTGDSAFVGENNSFTVTVFDQNDEPLAGEDVNISIPADSPITTFDSLKTTDENGTATFVVTSEEVVSGETLTFFVQSDTSVRTTATKSFFLNGEGEIDGTVQNSETTDPVENASVWAVQQSRFRTNTFETNIPEPVVEGPQPKTTFDTLDANGDGVIYFRLVDNSTGEILDVSDDYRVQTPNGTDTAIRPLSALNTTNESVGEGFAVIDNDGNGEVTFGHTRLEPEQYYVQYSDTAPNNSDVDEVGDADNVGESFANLTEDDVQKDGADADTSEDAEPEPFVFAPTANLTQAATEQRAETSGANQVDAPGFVNSYGVDTGGTNENGQFKLDKLYTDFQAGVNYTVIADKAGFTKEYGEVFVTEDGQKFTDSPFQGLNLEPEPVEPAAVNITQVGVHPPLSETNGTADTSQIEPFDNQSDAFVQQVPRDQSVDVIEVETLDEDGNRINGTAIVEIEDNDTLADANNFEGDFVGVLGGDEVANGTDTITVNTGEDGVATLLLETDQKTESLETNKTATLTNDRSATDRSAVEFVGVVDFESASISGQVTDTDDTPLPDTVVYASEFEFDSGATNPQTKFTINPVGPNGQELDSQQTISADEVDESSDVFRVTRFEYNSTSSTYNETASANVTAGELEDYRFEDFPGVSVSIPPEARDFKLYTQTLDEVDASYTLDPVPAVNATTGGQDQETSYTVKGVKLTGEDADTVGNAKVAQALTPGFTGTANVVIPIEVTSNVGMVAGSLDAPANATAGDTVSVTADVENTGGAAGTETIEFRIDADGDGALDTTLDTETVTLSAGETTTVTLEGDTSGLDAGTYTHGVGVAGSSDFLTAELTIESESSGSTTVVDTYDDDGDGAINNTELLAALADYDGDATNSTPDDGVVSDTELLALLAAYDGDA